MIYALALISLFLSALWYNVIKYQRKRRAIRENGMVTLAVAVDSQEAREFSGDYDDRRTEKVYRHQLQYQAPDGTHSFHFKTRDSRLRLAVGERVEIVYRADKPEEAMLKREADASGGTSLAIACVITVALVFAAVMILVIRGIFA
jgi:hypothetical protein